MDYTQSRGNITELQCISAFMEYGFECSIPYGNGAKYDFIVDVNGCLYRIQCKSSKKVDENSFVFKCVSQTTNTQKTIKHRYTNKDIDFFATYYMGKVYLVPVEECSTAKTLRLNQPQNTGVINYNLAEDYEIEKVLLKKFSVSELEKPIVVNEINKYNNKKIYCANCGKIEVTRQGNYCVDCARKASRKVERPSREELKEMIRKESFTSLSNIYGVSDKAIVKWCEQYKIPSRKSDIRKYSDEEWSII